MYYLRMHFYNNYVISFTKKTFDTTDAKNYLHIRTSQ